MLNVVLRSCYDAIRFANRAVRGQLSAILAECLQLMAKKRGTCHDRTSRHREGAEEAAGGGVPHAPLTLSWRRGGQGAVPKAGEPAAYRRLQATRRVQQDFLAVTRGAQPRGRSPFQWQPR